LKKDKDDTAKEKDPKNKDKKGKKEKNEKGDTKKKSAKSKGSKKGDENQKIIDAAKKRHDDKEAKGFTGFKWMGDHDEDYESDGHYDWETARWAIDWLNPLFKHLIMKTSTNSYLGL